MGVGCLLVFEDKNGRSGVKTFDVLALHFSWCSRWKRDLLLFLWRGCLKAFRGPLGTGTLTKFRAGALRL